jgi:hypothetical protein
VTGVQTCALPISCKAVDDRRSAPSFRITVAPFHSFLRRLVSLKKKSLSILDGQKNENFIERKMKVEKLYLMVITSEDFN